MKHLQGARQFLMLTSRGRYSIINPTIQGRMSALMGQILWTATAHVYPVTPQPDHQSRLLWSCSLLSVRPALNGSFSFLHTEDFWFMKRKTSFLSRGHHQADEVTTILPVKTSGLISTIRFRFGLWVSIKFELLPKSSCDWETISLIWVWIPLNIDCRFYTVFCTD